LEAQQKAEQWLNIHDNVTGILFFGTPFRGAEQQGQMELIKTAESMYKGSVQSEVLRITQPGDELLMETVNQFEYLRQRSKIKALITCFYELMPCNVMAILGKEGNKVCPA
jgi:hypothetical protein